MSPRCITAVLNGIATLPRASTAIIPASAPSGSRRSRITVEQASATPRPRWRMRADTSWAATVRIIASPVPVAEIAQVASSA